MFSNNPFNILDIPMSADHKRIYSAVDDMSLLLDSAKCEDAASILISPVKRLDAELDWFPECDENTVRKIREAAGSGKTIGSIGGGQGGHGVHGLCGISKVNAALYDLGLTLEKTESGSGGLSGDDIAARIIAIDTDFRSCTADQLLQAINGKRRSAGITEAGAAGILDALDAKRSRMASDITGMLTRLEDEEYVTLANLLAGFIRDDPASSVGSMIPELIDRYEIQMQPLIQAQTKKLTRAAFRLKLFVIIFDIKGKIKGLCERIEEWLRYTQPLITVAAGRGSENKYCAEVGLDIREIVKLTIKNKNCHSAYILAVKLKEYFADLPSVVKELDRDIESSLSFLKNVYGKTPEEFVEFQKKGRDVLWKMLLAFTIFSELLFLYVQLFWKGN